MAASRFEPGAASAAAIAALPILMAVCACSHSRGPEIRYTQREALQEREEQVAQQRDEERASERQRHAREVRAQLDAQRREARKRREAQGAREAQKSADDGSDEDGLATIPRAVGAGMQAYGEGLQGREAPVASARTCSSDYDCGYGNVCAKDSGAFRGICAKAVTAYGVPTFQPPRTDSLAPGQGQCMFDTQCPMGFRCVKTSGGLRGNCLK